MRLSPRRRGRNDPEDRRPETKASSSREQRERRNSASYRSAWIDATSNLSGSERTKMKSSEWRSKGERLGGPVRILHCSRINESSRRRPSNACPEVLEPARAVFHFFFFFFFFADRVNESSCSVPRGKRGKGRTSGGGRRQQRKAEWEGGRSHENNTSWGGRKITSRRLGLVPFFLFTDRGALRAGNRAR